MGRPRQRPIGVEYFLPADELTPEKKIARAVIAQAALDAVSRDRLLRLEALHFFFGDTPSRRAVRDHWFETAQLPLPDAINLRAGLTAAVTDVTVARTTALTEAWITWRRQEKVRIIEVEKEEEW